MAVRNKSVAEEQVTSVLAPGEVPIYERELTADDEALAALGYKPEFKREFSLWTSFCVSFAVLGLLPSFASTLYYVSTHADRLSQRERALMAGYTGHGLRGNAGHAEDYTMLLQSWLLRDGVRWPLVSSPAYNKSATAAELK
ncbi:MAG: hypothetical protein Q9225_000499 [Loekoesia sp. 1 TL-2023]